MASLTRTIAIAVLFCACSGISAQDSEDGSCNGYGFGEEQEEEWGNCYPMCNGDMQSPIDIELKDVVIEDLDFLNGPFYIDRSIPFHFNLTNDNYTVTLKLIDAGYLYLKGGPLDGRYYLEHIQFCWGSDDSKGSEHTFDNTTHAMEGQWGLYHENYTSYDEAAQHEGGVLRIAQIYPIQEEDNPAFSVIVKALPDVVEPNQTTTSNETLTYDTLLSGFPIDDYFYYNGSFTTPPCSETVKWLVYYPLIGVSSEQVAAFRNLQSTDGPLVNNFRSVQPLNGRKVVRSNKGSICIGECDPPAETERPCAGQSRKASKSRRHGASRHGTSRHAASKHRGAARRHQH